MEDLDKDTVLIVLPYTIVSNQHVVYLQLTQRHMSIISVKLEKNERKGKSKDFLKKMIWDISERRSEAQMLGVWPQLLKV